jgi:hypothetical protein
MEGCEVGVDVDLALEHRQRKREQHQQGRADPEGESPPLTVGE